MDDLLTPEVGNWRHRGWFMNPVGVICQLTSHDGYQHLRELSEMKSLHDRVTPHAN